jgi:hypothetical protein
MINLLNTVVQEIKIDLENINSVQNDSSYIEIKPSCLHGNGLFAARDIPKNTIITYYPMDAFSFPTSDTIFFTKNSSENLKSNILQAEIDYSINTEYKYKDQIFDITLYGDSLKYDDLKFVGHMINDSCGNLFANLENKDKNNEIKIKNAIFKYCIDSINKNNAYFDAQDNKLCVKSLRSIKCGEELLVGYEWYHWYKKQFNEFFPDSILDEQFLDKLNQICVLFCKKNANFA